MKVVILAGGLGSRLSEFTHSIPKPMVKVGGKPIIFHIMKHFAKYNHKDFYIALGYKGNILKKYFKTNNTFDWNINLINTGAKTMTGGRLKRLNNFLAKESFFLTYGDGISNVDIDKLLKFHNNKKKQVTLTAVRPPARFGAIKIKDDHVKYFKEKSNLDEGWINGGFFVINPEFLKNIKNDKTYLEREPLEIMTKKKQLVAYKHYGYWHCMDTKRDKDNLDLLFKKKLIK